MSCVAAVIGPGRWRVNAWLHRQTERSSRHLGIKVDEMAATMEAGR
jgi:hypothetical protein